jgi:hypothetical protein
VGKKKSLSFDERNCTAMMAWQVLKKTHGKTSRWQRPLKAYGKENIDGKAVSRRTTKPPNTAKLPTVFNKRMAKKSLPSMLLPCDLCRAASHSKTFAVHIGSFVCTAKSCFL